ncbi:MAG TPA: hypothetical protein VI452_01720 [Marmoricola sp.]
MTASNPADLPEGQRPPGGGWAEVDRHDVEAILEVRRELGPAYDDAVVDAFADRVERAIAARVDARIAHEQALRRAEGRRDGGQVALGITSLALGVPISGIAAGISHLPGLVVAWGGIAVVNLACAWQRRPRR